MNERTKMINRLIDYAQADPPVLFSVNDAATAADLDEAVRIISSFREDEREGLSPPASLPK